MTKYDPKEIETKWQKEWEKSGIYEAKDFSNKKKFYLLVEFPYCSGVGLHIGHARPWLPTDALARKKRMDGYNVLFPMGWDAFGLPTENYAIKTGRPPAEITAENIAHFRTQAKSLGLSFDWSREVDTSDPNYYKWTQWIFVQMFKQGLAYQAEVPVNWCPKCKTNLADEEVLGNGTHERCGTVVEKRLQKQWLLRITKYADRLIEDLKKVDYPNRVAVQQVNWIGKKVGRKIKFGEIEIFTTRPETILGATFVVLSPNHPQAGKVKTVINPASKKEIPVFVDEYVLDSVGTGAIMGVPAHDERDMVFAKKMNLPIIEAPEYKKEIGEKATIYHLHDWIFSRQHYWGEPIPIIHCPKCGVVPVSEDQLPVKLPFLEKYEPSGTGESPLVTVPGWVNVACPKCGGKAKRETDTMPNWAGSNWYFIRYLDPHNDHELAGKKLMAYWLPVDVYEGGYEHTTLHLLYSRFIYKFLFDIGVVPNDEPYASRKVHGILLASDNRKMSKSLGNVIDPIEVVTKYGSDTLRLYEMFIGPFDQQVSWNDRSLAGCYRLCNRVFALQTKVGGVSSSDFKNSLAKAIEKIDSDLDQMKFNTAVAAIMGFVNVCEAQKEIVKAEWQTFLTVLAPFAPHLTEELWHGLGNKESIHLQRWPKVDITHLEPGNSVIAISINGKTKTTIKISSHEVKVLTEAEIVQTAKKDNKVSKLLEGREIKRTIYVVGKILNFVV